MGRFEAEILSTKLNLKTLMDLSGRWIDKVHQRKPFKEPILDMDSSVSETYGDQQGTAYNGHFECMCYHPLFLFNQLGDLERLMLRRGNHASAKFWRRVLLPVIERCRHCDTPKFFRGNAAFAEPALYGELEEAGYRYVIRLKASAVLEREIEHLLTRPVGRPVKSDPRRKNQRANWNATQLSASMEELSLGACLGDAQMGNPGLELEPVAMSIRVALPLIRRRFLKDSVASLAAISLSTALPVHAARSKKPLLVGASKRRVTPPLSVPYLTSSGNGTNAPFQGLHDDLFARALVLDDGDRQIALLSVDAIGYDNSILGQGRDFTRSCAGKSPRAPA